MPGAAGSAADSMCFARTAALQGGYEKQKMNASRIFCSNHSTMSKIASKALHKTRFVAVRDMLPSL